VAGGIGRTIGVFGACAGYSGELNRARGDDRAAAWGAAWFGGEAVSQGGTGNNRAANGA